MKPLLFWDFDPLGDSVSPGDSRVTIRLKQVSHPLFALAVFVSLLMKLATPPFWELGYENAMSAVFPVVVAAITWYLAEYTQLIFLPPLDYRSSMHLAFIGNIIPFFPLIVILSKVDLSLTLFKAIIFALCIVAWKTFFYPSLLRGFTKVKVEKSALRINLIAGLIAFGAFYLWFAGLSNMLKP